MNGFKRLYNYVFDLDIPKTARILTNPDKQAELQYDDIRNPVLVLDNTLDIGVLSLYGFPRRLIYYTWNILLSKDLNVTTRLTGACRDKLVIELDDMEFKLRIEYPVGNNTRTTFECIDMSNGTVRDSEITTDCNLICKPH